MSQPPLSELRSFLTPNDQFYVRDHFVERPTLDPANWRLTVSGLVDKPLVLTLDDVQVMPSRTLTVTLECAGNGGHGRGASGSQGMQTMVGTATWTGVPLATVLARAKLRPEVAEVVAYGADGGTDPDEPVPVAAYARSLTADKALEPDTLVAWAMNGDPLPADHGAPARLVVPGWYGMDAVKWLVRLDAVAQPFEGFYMRHRYREHVTSEGLHEGRMVREMQVKSCITTPGNAARVLKGAVRIEGFAWAGRHDIASVQVSLDGGQSWRDADLGEDLEPYAWRAWHLEWTAERTGPFDVVARARDSAGRVQPADSWPRRTYEANWQHRVRVFVVNGLKPVDEVTTGNPREE